jgi:putative hydrolase of the HAD superfamily
MTSAIGLVLFDMDNVLVQYDRPARAAHLAQVCGMSPEAVMAAIWGSGYEFRGDDGSQTAEEYLAGFSSRLGGGISLEDWLAARQAAMVPDKAMLELATLLRAGGVGTALLTNNSDLVIRYIDRLAPGLREAVGPDLFASASLGAAKPDPEVYRRCLNRLGVLPETVLFVDDLAENVAGARQVGLFAHHFTGVAGFREALAAHGLPQ